ncbi:hypothetical protein KIN20_020802 [Parelaphostrongylus tenuis]|uniref:Uncharacterized protein n=1 Tax=Parelaphostrongylus tenuis TaxID=148309 RepID=A0AAD5NA83_PARTN|nr:hypothetical protein KIN20_020802 [Parelaphostrongylus tenuis]
MHALGRTGAHNTTSDEKKAIGLDDNIDRSSRDALCSMHNIVEANMWLSDLCIDLLSLQSTKKKTNRNSEASAVVEKFLRHYKCRRIYMDITLPLGLQGEWPRILNE